MKTDAKKLIENWFWEHDHDDDDFVCGRETVLYSVIVPNDITGSMIYTTKPTSVSIAIDHCDVSSNLGMVGRNGLPSESDLSWICDVVGPRALLFLGDMDPVDLLIFAWIRASLPSNRIIHMGVNDAFLKRLQLTLPKSFAMPCSSSEQESLALLKDVFPDFREVLGHENAHRLEQGQKIELEAVVSAKGKASAILDGLGRNDKMK